MAMQLGRQVDNMLTDRFRETAALAGSELYSAANHGINGNLYDILTKNSTYKSPVFLVRTKDICHTRYHVHHTGDLSGGCWY